MKNSVKSFKCIGTYYDLENEINRYCRNNNCTPISISVVFSAGTYVAFVVVEKGGSNG